MATSSPTTCRGGWRGGDRGHPESGTYGSLVLNANGTYTYTLNPNDGDFKALTGAGWAVKCSPTP